MISTAARMGCTAALAYDRGWGTAAQRCVLLANQHLAAVPALGCGAPKKGAGAARYRPAPLCGTR
eukprot:4946521-Prymnesium_polylepis.1